MLQSDKPLIVYYVHHHGSGHIAQFYSFAPHLLQKFRIHVIAAAKHVVSQIEAMALEHVTTSLMPSKWSATTSEGFVHTFSRAFEGVPYRQEPAIRSRWLAELFINEKPALFLSDGSIELSIMARSMGVRTVFVHLHGHFKQDPTQVFAHEVSDALIAPYPVEMEDKTYPYKDKTFYTGYFSKYQLNDRAVATDERVSILLGYDNASREVLSRITENASYSFSVIGNKMPVIERENVRAYGRVDDIKKYITGEVVITAAGTNSIAELLTLGKKLILLPEDRPYDEQLHTAELLAQHEYAVLARADMTSEQWHDAIEHARKIDVSRVDQLINPHAAEMVTQWLGEQYA